MDDDGLDKLSNEELNELFMVEITNFHKADFCGNFSLLHEWMDKARAAGRQTKIVVQEAGATVQIWFAPKERALIGSTHVEAKAYSTARAAVIALLRAERAGI